MVVRAMMIGDVVGEGGLEALEAALPALAREYAADFTVVNGENAAGGFGITGTELARILAAGADVVTSGNHVWEKREFWPFLENESRMLRPANYPPGAAGRGVSVTVKPAGGGEEVAWVTVNLQGREFMPDIDCPFRGFDAALQSPEAAALKRRVVLVDFHAESAAEKESLGFYIDGRASVLAGTHTHTQTADAKLLPRGTAYLTDLGMTGVRESVLGMDPAVCLDRARFQVLYRMDCARPAPGVPRASVQGLIAAIDAGTGKALSIEAFTR